MIKEEPFARTYQKQQQKAISLIQRGILGHFPFINKRLLPEFEENILFRIFLVCQDKKPLSLQLTQDGVASFAMHSL